MPTHELEDLGFVFPATSEDITKGSKSLLLPQHSAVFALQTKQTEPGSRVDEKFPSKKTFTEVKEWVRDLLILSSCSCRSTAAASEEGTGSLREGNYGITC